jgi:hypothetical protein
MYPLLDACALPGRGTPKRDGMENRMFAGVDTHKDTLAGAVIDHAGRVVRQLELPNQDSGYVRLLALLTSHNVVRVGVEGSGNFGWPAPIYLLQRDLNVVEVPPLMTSRERLSRPGQGKPTQGRDRDRPHYCPRGCLATSPTDDRPRRGSPGAHRPHRSGQCPGRGDSGPARPHADLDRAAR